MQRVFFTVVFLLLCGCVHLDKPAIEADYAFDNVHVIPMGRNIVLENKAIAVKDGVIVAILDQAHAQQIKALQRINGNSRYLMPGLADMHVHTRWNPEAMFNLYLAHGVTTVANMWLRDGDGAVDHLKLRDQVASGAIVGPRYLISGDHFQKDFPKSVADVERILNDYQQKNIDFVKVHGDLPEDIFQAVIAGSNNRNIKVIGHAQHSQPLAKSLEMDSLEHMEELLYVSRDQPIGVGVATDFLSAYRANVARLRDPGYRKLVVDDIADSGIYLDPTLIVYKMVGIWSSDEELASLRNDPDMLYLPKAVRDQWLNEETNPYQEEGFPIDKTEVESNLQVMFALTKELNDAGVTLILGTDTFGTMIPGKSAHLELGLLVEAGLTPFEALTCGTVNIADYLNETTVSGKIAEGYRADFILLDKNPLLDIKNVATVSGVFTHNRWHNAADLRHIAREKIR